MICHSELCRCSTSPLWPGAELGTRMGRYGKKKKKWVGFDNLQFLTLILRSCYIPVHM